MQLKKILAIVLSLAILTLALTGCGGSNSSEQTDGDSQAAEPVTVKLGVVGSIYEELWTPAKEALAEQGIDLEFVQFSDYVTPNNALANGEIDLNAFQHRIYLQSEVDSYGYEIQTIGNTFIIPLNLYSQKVSSVDELKDGDTVAIPDDLTNGGRALKVLEAARLAPSSYNGQPWRFVVYSNRIHIFSKKASVDRFKKWDELNFGIMFAHIMIVAEELWLDLDLIRLEDISQKTFSKNQYVLSAVLKS